VEPPSQGVTSAPPVASGEREAEAHAGDALANDRKTDPPPMTPEEYRRAFIMNLRPTGLTHPRIEAVVEEDLPLATLPPAARRGDSIARMDLPHPTTPSPPRTPNPVLDDDIPAVLVPRPPAVPALSIPPLSEEDRLAASTERPTALALDADLADRSRVVRHAMAKAHVAAMALDHRAGFLLSRIDGTMSIEELLDVSGMPPADALAILRDLYQRGVVTLDPSVSTRRDAESFVVSKRGRRER
jgi:hypothetical protein